MKKLVSFGLMAIVFAAFTFVSCDKEEDNNAETTKTEESGNNDETTKNDESEINGESAETVKKTPRQLLTREYKGGAYSFKAEYYNYVYSGNTVTYTVDQYSNGEKYQTLYYTEKYKDSEYKQLLTQEHKGGASSFKAEYYNYVYSGNTVTYTVDQYSNGEKYQTLNYKEVYNE